MNRNILIVDDEKDVCWLLSNILKSKGYEVAFVNDGQKVLDYIKHCTPDVVFLDLRLPNLGGMQILKKIKELNHFIQVIVITAYGDIKSAVDAMKLEAFDYMTKPFKNDEILLTLERSLRNKDLQIGKLKLEQKLREIQEQLFRSERLASLGQLTAGVAHETLNPLNIISCHIQLLLMDKDVNPKYSKSLKIMEEQVRRITRITDNLLNFCRGNQIKRDTLDINQILENIISLVKPGMDLNSIEIIKKLNPNLPFISGDGDQLTQAFLNLILNAKDAMNTGGNLTIISSFRCQNSNVGDQIRGKADLKNFIEISFQDSGCGISKENLKRIFEPLFTTKKVGKGTGLGLSVVYEIVEKHGGEIKVKSEKRRGTTFILKLPISGFPDSFDKDNQVSIFDSAYIKKGGKNN